MRSLFVNFLAGLPCVATLLIRGCGLGCGVVEGSDSLFSLSVSSRSPPVGGGGAVECGNMGLGPTEPVRGAVPAISLKAGCCLSVGGGVRSEASSSLLSEELLQ